MSFKLSAPTVPVTQPADKMMKIKNSFVKKKYIILNNGEQNYGQHQKLSGVQNPVRLQMKDHELVTIIQCIQITKSETQRV